MNALGIVSALASVPRGFVRVTLALALVCFPATLALAAPGGPDSLAAREPELPKKSLEIHLHGGVFMPVNTSQASGAAGLRIAGLVAKQVSMGLSVDGLFHTQNDLGAATQPLPASVYTPRKVNGDAGTLLLPVMGFVQLTLWRHGPLVPYGGIGGGYEWLHSVAHDYQTGSSFHATFSNWAWLAWTGLGIPLSRELRIDGEVFYNGGSLGRDLHDTSGQLTRELVKVDGAGFRCGLNFTH
jgi:hypothetical protein